MLTARMNRMFPELSMLPRMERVVESLLTPTTGPVNGPAVQPVFPALNSWEDEQNVYVEAELPGWALGELEICMAGNELTIAGRRAEREVDKGVTLHRRERLSGQAAFKRSLEFGVPIDAERVGATLERGVLTVTLPKAAAAKPKKIEIKGA